MRCVSRQLTKPSAPLGALTCVSWRRPDCVAGHIGLELANVALTRRDLNRSLPGVREKSLVRKCCVNPRSSAEITKNRHFRVRVLSPQPGSAVSVGRVRYLRKCADDTTKQELLDNLLDELRPLFPS